MLYIIGGLPRMGKTLVGSILSKEHRIPGIDTDMLRTMFEIDKDSKIGFNANASIEDVTKAIWPYLKSIIQTVLSEDHDFYLTGEPLDPLLLKEFKLNKNCRICFLGFNNLNLKYKAIKEHPTHNDWTKKLKNDDELVQILLKFQKRSKQLEKRCRNTGIKFFDTTYDYPRISLDYEATIKQVIKFLRPKEAIRPLIVNKLIKDYTQH